MFRHEALRPLSRQHHNGLALCIMAARGIEQRGERAVKDWSARAVERYDVELTNHFSAEETILFPAIRSTMGECPLVDALVAEHRKMEELINRLRDSASRDTLDEFLELLKSHIRREENELFEMVQKQMPPEAIAALEEPLKSMVAEICLSVENNEEP